MKDARKRRRRQADDHKARTTSYVACPISRPRRLKAEISAIREAIVEIIRADPPMTVRQTFYQLVARGIIEKTEAEYNRTVIRLMTDMRLDGSLPFWCVVDETRRARVTETFDDVRDALTQTAKFYRRSALAQSSDYVEIWCEKDALAGVLWEVTSQYDVPLMVSRGMPSLTFLYGSAQAIRHAGELGKYTYIYQFGDHDPSGVLIPQTIARRLDQMCERMDCAPPQVERIALTQRQISRYRLPTRPTKRERNRHAASFVGDSVELDALPPGVLRKLAREAIEQHVSASDTIALRAAEESEREILTKLAGRRLK